MTFANVLYALLPEDTREEIRDIARNASEMVQEINRNANTTTMTGEAAIATIATLVWCAREIRHIQKLGADLRKELRDRAVIGRS